MMHFARGLAGSKTSSIFALAVLCYSALASVSAVLAEESPIVRQLGVYGKWALFCKPSPSTASDCALAQVVQDRDHQSTKLRMGVSFDDKWDLLFKIKVEPRPVQSEGIALLIDGVQNAGLLPKTCDTDGCSATFYPSTKMLARALSGSVLDAQFRTDPRVGVSLGIDLPKLYDAIIAMRKQLPFRAEGEGWAASSNAPTAKDYNVGLVNVSDLPRGKMLDAQVLKEASALATTFLDCDSRGVTTGEHGLNPVKISVSANFELDYTDSSRTALNQIADTMHRCGDHMFVTVVPDSNSYSSKTLSSVQEAAVESLLRDHGVDRLLIADQTTGIVHTSYPENYVGGWSASSDERK